MDIKTISTFLNKLSYNQLFESCKKENDEIEHFNFIYDERPNKNTLIVLCTYKSDPYNQIKVGEYECDPLMFSYILIGLLDDPKWITSNPNEPCNVFVETNYVR